jgi:hypothetical protein
MAERSSRRFYLADLVAAVLLCGLVAAMLASRRSLDESPYVPIGAFVFAMWYFLRSRRSAPTCDRCGQRFVPPKAPDPAIDCPQCGARQATLARALKRRETLYSTMPVLIGFSAIVALMVAMEASKDQEPLEGGRLMVVVIAAGFAVLAGLAMAGIGASRTRLAQPRDQSCEACGGVIPAKPPAPLTCPTCLGQRPDLERSETEQAKGRRLMLIVGGGLALGVVFSLVMFVPRMVSSGNWQVLPFVLPAVVIPLLLGGWLLRLWSRSVKFQALMSEEGALARARQSAGEEGTVVPEGPATIWYSGPADPVPMLREEISAAHRRFEILLGETGIADPAIRILCFHERAALQGFYKASFPGVDVADQLGLYLQRPVCVLMLCTSDVPGRLADPASTAGALYDLVLMEQVFPALPAPWVQNGLIRALGAHGRPGELARLNRRMVAALSAGAAWSEDLFSTSVIKMSRLQQRSKEPKSQRKSELFGDQGWSIVEYLGGESAPAARRSAFRAFLKDTRSVTQQEASFFQQFGFGFGSLLDDWRQWVLGQGIGADEPPPPPLREGLVNRVLPIIRDRHARREDRIQAIRDWRKAGFVLGADALIDLLRDPGDIPKEEIVWSLCMASGMAWDDEPERWQTWWSELPRKLDRPAEVAST